MEILDLEELYIGFSDCEDFTEDFKEDNNDLTDMLLLKAKRLSSMLDVHEDIAMLFLLQNFYDQDKTIEKYLNNKEEMLNSIGISDDDIKTPQELHKYNGNKSIGCIICCRVRKNLFSLTCKHYFCSDCWNKYIHSTITSGNVVVKCMDPDCNCKLLFYYSSPLCDRNIYNMWIQRLNSNSLHLSDDVRQCTNPKCLKLFNKNSGIVNNTYKCVCGERYCWLCGAEAHMPTSCLVAEEWIALQKDRINDYIIQRLTKKCPKCRVNIEKNLGCNHMTCTNCRYEFCWICLKKWDTINHDPFLCNDVEDAMLNAEVFENKDYYIDGFLEQNQYQMEDRKLLVEYRKILVEGLKKEYTLEEDLDNKVNSIIDLLIETRSYLKWTYPYLYTHEKEKNAAATNIRFWNISIMKDFAQINFNIETLKLKNVETFKKNLNRLQADVTAYISIILKM